MNLRITALTIAAVALLGLTACTGTPSTGSDAGTSGKPSTSASSAPEASGGTDGGSAASDSIADACNVVGQAITDATAGMEGMEPSADPQAAIDAMNASATAIGDAIGQIDNEEVAAAAKGMQEGFAGIAEATKAVLDGDVAKASEMEELSAQFQESFTAFQQLCVQG